MTLYICRHSLGGSCVDDVCMPYSIYRGISMKIKLTYCNENTKDKMASVYFQGCYGETIILG